MADKTFVQYRLDTLDPRHGQPGGTVGQPPTYPDGSCDEGRAWALALGGAQDAETQLLKTAYQSRLPTLCPDDALDVIGPGAFALPRLPGQTNASYRTQLVNAFPTYNIGGSADAVVQSLQAYGFGDVRIITMDQDTIPPESGATSYSAFYVVLGPNFGTTGIAATLLGACTLGSCTLGSTATSQQILSVKLQVLRWKAAHGYPIKILLDFGQGIFGSSPTYPMGRTLGDTMPALGDAGCILGGYQ